jgi:glyoxylase-like metal-dependent hydrolase (beta-lactamase superfamily II)
VDGVLASGDALVTGHALLPSPGPQLLPEMFSHSQQDCVRSLEVLAGVDAQVLAPGHGPLWRGSVSDAAARAAQRAS